MPQQAEFAPPTLDAKAKGSEQNEPARRLGVAGEADKDNDQPIIHALLAPVRPAPGPALAWRAIFPNWDRGGQRREFAPPPRGGKIERRLAMASKAGFDRAICQEESMVQNRLIDLSSDTSTRPSAGMRKAMSEAEVGDEQSAADPTTNRLQERIAELLGKEAAVLLPSGTMCNQIALLVHCRPGDEVIAADLAHIFTSEAGGGSCFAGVQSWPLATKRGIFTAAEVTAAVREPGGRHSPRSRLVALEQTVNRGGGAIWPVDTIEAVASCARQHGLRLHMDGARILN